MASREDLETFIASTFRSVWALELLCHLRKVEGREMTPVELVAAMRASESVVLQGLAELTASGLVLFVEDGSVRYAPANPALDRLAAAAQARYATAPDAVRRIIVKAANPGPTAFADAFRLKGKP